MQIEKNFFTKKSKNHSKECHVGDCTNKIDINDFDNGLSKDDITGKIEYVPICKYH